MQLRRSLAVFLVAASLAVTALVARASPNLVDINSMDVFNTHCGPNTEHLSFVMWTTDWCHACHAYSSAIAVIANHFGMRNEELWTMKLNAGQYEQLAREYKVTSYPTFMLFGPGFEKPIKYTGDEDPDEVIDWLEERIKKDLKKKPKPVRIDTTIGGGQGSMPPPKPEPVPEDD